jgi:hypothetical protein
MKWQAERRQFRLHDDDFDANLKINWLFSVALALELGQETPRWALVPKPISTRLFRWKQGELCNHDDLRYKPEILTLATTYKAIRRQITKRYLCGHAACVSEVMNMLSLPPL